MKRICRYFHMKYEILSMIFINFCKIYLQNRLQSQTHGIQCFTQSIENLRGWEKIPSKPEELLVEVQVGGEKEAIEHYIKEDIMFNQEFKKD
mgnify:CR=1 FL=1